MDGVRELLAAIQADMADMADLLAATSAARVVELEAELDALRSNREG